MTAPIALASRLKAAPDARERCLAFLDKVRAEVDAGHIDTVFVLTRAVDSMWMADFCGAAYTVDMIGRMEIAKHEIMSEYLKSVT